MNAARVTFFNDEPPARRLLRTHFFDTVLNQLSDAVVLYDKNLEIVGVNQAAERLFGMLAEEMIGQACEGLFHCSSYEPHGSMGQATGESTCLPTGTFNLHVKNGRQRLVVIRTVQLRDDANGVEGVVATIKDITEESHPVARRVIAESQAMRDLLDFVRKIAVSEATSVFIEGENGTGKDLIAKTLHDQSSRQAEPFLAINCAAIPETLLESELFGFEKGAFTDARAQKRGLFELADKGTLFLDEIGEMSLPLQAKLLRVLEDQTFRRLGGLRDLRVDIRIVAATNKDIGEALKEGAFRQDLYYRLSVIQLVVPPLRERLQDILPLARFFVEHYNFKFKQQIEGLSSEAESLLLTYNWPGNVRELRNAIERAMILEDTTHIRPASLHIAAVTRESAFRAAAADGSGPCAGDGLSLRENERRMLKQALDMAGWNQSQAARLLRITRDTLRYKMKKFQLFRGDDL